MKLRTMTMVACAILIAAAVMGNMAAVQIWVVSQVEEVRNQGLARAATAFRKGLSMETGDLARFVTDWANWDDTVAYMNGSYPGYEASNLVPEVFDEQGLSAIVLLDTEGVAVWVGTADNLSGKDDVAARAVRLVTRGGKAVSGLANLGGRLFAVASRPVLSSVGEGPSPGTLSMFREITPDIMDDLAALIGTPVRMAVGSDGGAPGSFVLRGMFGEPVAWLDIDIQDHLHEGLDKVLAEDRLVMVLGLSVFTVFFSPSSARSS